VLLGGTMSDTCWRTLIGEALAEHDETWADVVATTLTEQQLEAVFNDGYGGTDGAPFTLWTAKRVYFPACYDGLEWVASVARHPDSVPTDHVGGG
jgi:hypothetical protein